MIYNLAIRCSICSDIITVAKIKRITTDTLDNNVKKNKLDVATFKVKTEHFTYEGVLCRQCSQIFTSCDSLDKVTKIAKKSGNGSSAILPKAWIGSKVLVYRVEKGKL